MASFWAGDDDGAYAHNDLIGEFAILVINKTPFPSSANPVPVVIDGATSRVIDKKKKVDKNGGLINDRGYRAAEFTVSFEMWTKGQWDDLEQVIPQIHPKDGAKGSKGSSDSGDRPALDVFHPFLARLGISRAHVTSLSIPKETGQWGVMSMQMKMIEVFEGTTKKASKKVIPKGARQAAVKASFQSGDNAVPTVPIDKTEIGPGEE